MRAEDAVKVHWIYTTSGAAMLLVSGALLLLEDDLGGFLPILLILGLGTFAGGWLEYLGLRRPTRDERAARIGTLATTYSWYASLLLVCGMGMVYGFGAGYKISMPAAVGTLVIAQVASMLVFNWYLGRKGDLE